MGAVAPALLPGAVPVAEAVDAFVDAAAAELGIALEWKGEGVKETGTVATLDRARLREAAGRESLDFAIKEGDVIVRVDPRYFRPTEVETLLGDPSKAKEKLGWTPKISFEDMVAEMVREDLSIGMRDALCKVAGFKSFERGE